MPEIWNRRLSSPGRLLIWTLLGPLVFPALALGVRFAAGGLAAVSAPSAGWFLLGLVGPAIPVYLVVLPLLPWALLGLRRGRVLRLGPVWLGIAALSACFDLAFYLARV